MPKINAAPAKAPVAPPRHKDTPRERSESFLDALARAVALPQGIKTDDDALDDQLIAQPEGYFHVAEEQAFAVSYRDEAKSILEQISAEVDAAIRAAAAHSEDKVTEPQIKAKLALSPKVMAAADELAAWQLLVARWAALNNAYEHRRRMLDLIVRKRISDRVDASLGHTARRDMRDRAVDEIRSRGE